MPSPKAGELARRLVEIWHWVYQHSNTPFTSKDVAANTGLHRKTVQRSIKTLTEPPLGIPIWFDRRANRYRVGSKISAPPVSLTLAEAMNLYLAVRLLSKHADKSFPVVRSTFAKLASALPPSISTHVFETASALADGHRNEMFADVFGKLAEAWAGRRRVNILYPSSGGGDSVRDRHWRLLEPYFIEPSLAGHSCYVIGRDANLDAIRTFKIERIVDLQTTDQEFDLPSDWSPTAYLSGLWDIYGGEEAEVVIRFSPCVASRVLETVWHSSQESAPGPGGSLLVTFRVRGTVEITPWILSWGDEAEVLAPESLRANIGEIARRQASLYPPAQS